MTLALTNCDIFDGESFVTNKALVIENGSIHSLCDTDEIPEGSEIKDMKGLTVTAGYVDMQVNGGGGVLLNDNSSQDSILKVLNAHCSYGTTSVFPTVFTSSLDRMQQLFDESIALKSKGETRIGGLHFEGPVINDAKAGVHDKNFIRKGEERIVDLYIKAAKEFPTFVTLAPEKVDTDLIKELRSHGVLVFGGHTNASYEESNIAFSAGLQGVTHLYNASSGPSSRAPGIVGAALTNDDVYFSIIADGFHVHWASIDMAVRCKQPGKAFLVTDAMPAVGFDGDTFMIGDLQVFVRENQCQTNDGVLAGSALDMASAVRNCVQKIGFPREKAIKMATLYPAKFAQIDQSVGSIEVGKDANLVAVDNENYVHQVFVNGQPH